MRTEGGSRTAVFVCQGRAAADGRLAVGVFADPFATRLLNDQERAPVLQVRAGDVPLDGRDRFAVASVAACAEVVVPRSVRIDRALTDALNEVHRAGSGAQVVILGAGLDARPWRMPALAGVIVMSVDHPASQRDAERRSAGLPEPACDLRRVPVDLGTDPLRPALMSSGFDTAQPTVWIWEGVIPYLERAAVYATFEATSALSAPGSRLIANYQTRSVTATIGRRLSGLMARASGVESVLADEPWRSTWTPSSFAKAVSGFGWAVTSDESLLEVARAIGSPTGRRRSLVNGRVAVATR